MKEIKDVIEKRIKELTISKNNSNLLNGQIWARKEELKKLLLEIKQIESRNL